MTFAPASDWDTIERALHAWVVKGSGLPNGSVIWSGFGKRRPQTVTTPPPDSQWISLTGSDLSEGMNPWVEETPNPLTFTPFTFTATAAPSPGHLNATAHGRLTGDGPVRLTTTGVLPGGTALAKDYWAIVSGANTLQLAASFEDSVADVPVPITILDAGTGTHTISVTADTLRAGQEIVHTVWMLTEASLSIQCYGGPPVGPTNPLSVLQTVVASAWLPSQREAFEAAGIGITETGTVNNVGALINSARWEPRAHVDVKLWITASVSETGTVIETVEMTMTQLIPDDDGNIDTADTVFEIS